LKAPEQCATATACLEKMRMRQRPLLISFPSILALAAVVASPSNAQKVQSPCEQIRATCRVAGFAPGGVKDGTGILIDCITPIMQGTTQRPQATKPLPQIDAEVVRACKSANPTFGRQEAPAVHELSTADLGAFLDPLINDQLAQLKIAGAVVVVVKDDGILFAKGYGYADVENKRPMTADATLVRPGSISKLFTGIAVMQLVEQGKLDLDRDVNDYLDFQVPTPDGGVPVTLRRLMTHRAGFEEHAKSLFSADRVPETLGHWLARSLPPRLFPSGDVSAYSNYGMALAGYIVERAAREPFADYVADHILRPLGMTHTTFHQPLPADLAPLVARSYVWSDRLPWSFFETVPAAPAGALSATGLDMGRFMLALLHGGSLEGARVLREESLAQMMAPQIMTATGRMGLVFYELRLAGARIVVHEGGTMSFFSTLLVSPENRFGLFVSFDGRAGAQALNNLVLGFARRYLPLSSPGSGSSPARREDAEAVAGVYQTSRRADSTIVRLAALTSEIWIRPSGDATITLYGGPFGTGQSFHGTGERQFRGPKGREVAFDEVLGHATRLNIGPAVLEWQRVPLYLDIRLVAPAVIVSALVGVLSLIAWPVAAILRRWRGRRWSEDAWVRHYHLGARLVLILQLLVIAAAATLFVAGTANLTILSDTLDPALIALYACAWLSVLGGFGMLWVSWQFWRKRIGGLWTRLHHTLIAASALTLAWFFLNWHIAGTTLIY
jgi:CubicO group peptidase (beta-lactamase class C family)